MTTSPTDLEDPQVCCLVTILSMVLITPLAVLRGWVLSILWGWFLVPVGVRPIGIAHAIGVSILISMLTHQHQSTKATTETMIKGVLIGLIGPLIALGMAAVAHWFMPAAAAAAVVAEEVK